MDIVYEVLCERVLFGEDVLPPHVAKWFVAFGNQLQEDYIEKRGSPHMSACYDVYHRQVLERGQGVVTMNPYEFMIGYHKYSKYLPIVMYLRAVFTKNQAIGASVKTLLDRGCSYSLIHLFVGTARLKDVADSRSPMGIRKKRRLQRVAKSDPIRKLYSLVQSILALEGCHEISAAVLSFLV